MKKAIETLKLPPFDTQVIMAILAILVGLVFLLAFYFLVRKLLAPYKVKEKKKRLENILSNFGESCEQHYKAAAQGIKNYPLRKGNELDGKLIFNNPTGLIESINSIALFKEFSFLWKEKNISRIAATANNLTYLVRYHHDEITNYLLSFFKQYEEALKEYFQNIYNLTVLHDELAQYVKGKTLNKAASEWLDAFFVIFNKWVNDGANKDLDVTRSEIVLKVIELNKTHSNNPFVSQTNEMALKCEFAYYNISKLDETFLKKLKEYSWAYKKAAKVAFLISSRIHLKLDKRDLLDTTTPVVNIKKSYSTKEKRLTYSGMLLVSMIGFMGGLYLNNKPSSSISNKPNLKPIIPIFDTSSYIIKPIKDTSSKKLIKPIVSPPVIDIDTTAKEIIMPVSDTATVDIFPPIDTAHSVYGIDISKYQKKLLKEHGNLDTLHFVICKATEGKSEVDRRFKYNWNTLRKMNVLRGAYHFYNTKVNPVKQAQHFLKTVGTLNKTDLPLVLDIEELSLKSSIRPADLQRDLLLFLQYVEQKSKRKPIIYTNLHFANLYLRYKLFADYPLWVAQYPKNVKRLAPHLPITWQEKGYTFWQKSDSYKFGSVNTDFDVFNGNGAELIDFIKTH